MGLLKRLLGGGVSGAKAVSKAGAAASTQFHESETTAQPASSANAPRRELVQVVLRDTMRKHAIPSDWIDCRILSVVTRQHQVGMHVQFIVRDGEDKLLPYVRAFQKTFWTELEKFEAQPREWLFSVAWQFEGATRNGRSDPPPDWDVDTQPPEDTRAHSEAGGADTSVQDADELA